MGFKIIFIILFLLESVFTPVIAQDIKFEYITPDDGLSHSSITSILQDKEGFMWFGTMNGLNKFDGYKFVKYYHNPKDSNSIAGDQIDCIFEDSYGELWIGSDGGLSQYDRDRDAFINFRHTEKDPGSLSGQRVYCIYEDVRARLWISAIGKGLNLFDRNKKKFIHFVHNENDPNTLNNDDICSIVDDRNGNIILGTRGLGINILNPESKVITHLIHNALDPLSLPNNDVFVITKDNQGTIWIGTVGGGLCRLNSTKTGKYFFDTFKPPTNDTRRFAILSLCADQKGCIWVGTENGGLDYFDSKNKTFVNYRNDENNPNSLNNNSVHAIYEDRTGNLWVGTYTGGINVVKKNKKKFSNYRKIPGNPNSLSYNVVKCFFEDDDGTLWIGTDGGGVNLMNRTNGKITHFNSRNTNLRGDVIMAICKDKDNDIWLGGWESGLNLYNRKDKTFSNFTQGKNETLSKNIFDILVDHKGRLWIATSGIGFGLYDKKYNTIVAYNTKNSKLPSDWVLTLAEDYAGNILLGHTNGFSIFNPENETFENYSRKDSDDNMLSNNQTNIILPAHDSTLWIGTINGLNHFNPKNKKFAIYYEQNGLPNNNIDGLVEDDHGYIWISTANGISKFDPKSGSFKNYTLADGLQGKGYIRNSCYKTLKGEILFGGTNGFDIFNPDSLFDNPNIPPVFITDFTIFNKTAKIGETDSPLRKHISQTSKITLSYKQSVFSFEFVALDYTAPDQNQYAYKLEGFENEWNYVGDKRTATYTNLNPGNYTFRVKGSNNDGKWNEEGISLAITITPPVWDTWLFRIVTIALFLLALIFIFRLHLRNLKKREEQLKIKIKESVNKLQQANYELKERQDEITTQNEELAKHRSHLEHLVDERTYELESALKKAESSDKLKSSFLANMSHEIRTPMNAIVGFSSLLKDFTLSEDEKHHYIDIINKNCDSLLVLINDILDISKIEANQINIYKTNFNIDNVLTELERFFKMRTSKNLEIKYIRTLSDVFIENDAIRFRQIFSNLLTNALKFTESGHIYFGFENLEDNLQFYVSDTGIGIDSSEYNNIFNPFTKLEFGRTKLYRGAGLGLSISKNLVEKMGGKIWVESVFGEGTTFYFSLPNNPKSAYSEDSSGIEKDIVSSNFSNINILIAEDEPANYLYLEKALKPTNATIHWAKNGLEAVDMFKNAVHIKFDLILMDIKMPILNGIDAFIEIRKLDKYVPIIAQSAYAQEVDQNQAIQIGFSDYLTKPIKPLDLVNVLRKFI